MLATRATSSEPLAHALNHVERAHAAGCTFEARLCVRRDRVRRPGAARGPGALLAVANHNAVRERRQRRWATNAEGLEKTDPGVRQNRPKRDFVPIWTAVLIALGGGIFGVLVRIAHDRGAELRSRMLEAADEFLATSTSALLDLGYVSPTILSGGAFRTIRTGGGKSPDQTMRDLHDAAEQLQLRLARVLLLFGQESAAAESARAVAGGVRDATNALEYFAVVGAVDQTGHAKSVHADYNDRYRKTHDAHNRFGHEARRALLPWWIRLTRRGP